MRNHEILYLFAGQGFIFLHSAALCITNTGERQASPRYFNLLKSLAEFAACGGKESQKNFPPGRVPGGKYLSGSKCASCAPQRTRRARRRLQKTCQKAPPGIFDSLEYRREASLSPISFILRP